MKAELVPENGDPPIPVTRDVVVVGRRGYCDVVIEHSSLSKRHCVLVKTDGLLVVRDLISTNGTKVKGQKVRWAALLPDDRLAFGNYKVRVYLGPDDVPSPSEVFRERQGRLGSARRQPVDAGQELPTGGTHGRPPVPAFRVPQGPPPSLTPGTMLNQEFPEPSPLEVSVANGDEAASKPSRRDDFEPSFPIVIDDSDEIIELD